MLAQNNSSMTGGAQSCEHAISHHATTKVSYELLGAEVEQQLAKATIDFTPSTDKAPSAVALLTKAICDVPSVSGDESFLCDVLEKHFRALPHLEVLRDGNALMARTHLQRNRRVIVAGHIDTVPIANNVPARFDTIDGQTVIWGRGSVDMKSGLATQLYAATVLDTPQHDVTWIFYDNEEVQEERNGLRRLCANHPEWVRGDFGILGEPTDAQVEGGCNGSVRVFVYFRGRTAHSARAWRGDNAVYKAIPALERISRYSAATVNVDGLDYRESLSVTDIRGGHAFNSIPDNVRVAINYRFAPDKTPDQGIAHILEVLDGLEFDYEVDDRIAGARPGLDNPLVQEFCRHALGEGEVVKPKYGWTDVARLSALGIPAVNYGCGDPMLCHTDNENCPLTHIDKCTRGLIEFLR